MAQQKAVRQLSVHEPASSAPARLAQCRASASDSGSLGDSTDGSSSIDIVGLICPKTTAARANHENGRVRWDGRSPKISMCGQSGSRRRLAPGSSRLQVDIDAPKQPLDQQGPKHPDSAAQIISNAEDPEPVDHAQRVVDSIPLSAVRAAAEEPQHLQHGTGSITYLGDFGDLSHNQHQRQGQQGGNKHVLQLYNEVRSDEGAAEEDAEQDNAGEQQWSSRVCCACNDGGRIILCDGPCQRAFHLGISQKSSRLFGRDSRKWAAAEELDMYDVSFCNPLGINQELAEHIVAACPAFECPNCLAQEHQCFICKQEGHSDNSEVVSCIKGSCGRFYHMQCLEQKFGRCKKRAEAEGLWAFGNAVCPSHTCKRCEQEEGALGRGALIPCARCPISYHLECMPEAVLASRKTRVWLASSEAQRWGEDHKMLQRPGVEPEGGVEDCILYCQRHSILADGCTPEHVRPLIASHLLSRWKLEMAQKFKHLEWSEQYRKKRELRLKLKEEAQRKEQAQQKSACKEQGASQTAPQAPHSARDQLTSRGKRKHKEQAVASAGVPAAAVQSEAESFKDIQVAQHLRGEPATPAAHAKRKAAGPGADAAACSQPAGADTGFGDLDGAPMFQQRKRHASPAFKDALLDSWVSNPQQAPDAQELSPVTYAQEERTPVHGEQLPCPDLPSTSPELGTAAQVLKAAELGYRLPVQNGMRAKAAEDMDTLENEHTGEQRGPQVMPAKQQLQMPTTQLLAFEQDDHWGRAKEMERTAAIMKAGPVRFPHQKVEILRPKPFDRREVKTIPWARQEQIAQTARMQMMREAQGTTSRGLITARDAEQYCGFQEKLWMYLAPLMLITRYTSYGRHFTQSDHLQALNRFLLPYIREGDTIVDFSCGANVWGPMLKTACLQQGIVVKGINYDIITPECMEGFCHETWFDVKPGSLPGGDKLVIGLNPPFGQDGTLAGGFAALAAHHRPRIIVLIVPPRTLMPPGYTTIKEDTTLMCGECFFVPGTNQKTWNNVTPATRILVRNDCLHQVMEMHDMDCKAEYSFQPR